tara:strand:+ start:20 stop:490 length:471 start_codon:yes stop_codon:yes gene_type:complete
MKNKTTRFSDNVVIHNKKASFNYVLIEKLEVGIELKGSEIKSIREGLVSLQEAHCVVLGREIFVRSMNIAIYKESSIYNHDPIRERKLLLKKNEIKRFRSKSEEKGLTIIPTKLYITKRSIAKMEIALAKGKKLHDKRESMKKKDHDRELKLIKII